MNLETRLDKRLWDATRSSVENRNFTGAVLDAMYFLSDLIRQRTGLEGDGVALVGQALGGNVPKLKVNRLQSESDWSIQKGTEQLLRGMYQAIRNPRSHEKYTDSGEDAQAILLFVNHLIKIVDQSRAPFVKAEFVKRVFDPDYVPSERYSKLLVDTIPTSQRVAVFFDVYRSKIDANEDALGSFFTALLAAMGEEERNQVFDAVSEELRTTDDESNVRLNIRAFGKHWTSLDEAARLRTENRLIRSIKEGWYSPDAKKCRSGALGTWAARIFAVFSLKGEALCELTEKLGSADVHSQDYVFTYLFTSMGKLADEPGYWLEQIILAGLQRGDERFRSVMNGLLPWPLEKWNEEVQKAVKEFAPSEAPPADDIPF
jgi:uncharacterized protein (TIGR02391 family)